MHINTQLGDRDAAKGVLEDARRHHAACFKESWYECLNDWTQARKQVLLTIAAPVLTACGSI